MTNGVDLTRFHPLQKDKALKSELGVENCFVAGYIGTHGMAHCLDTLLDAAQILSDDPQTDNVRILFLGHGAARDKLMERANEMGLENVIF